MTRFLLFYLIAYGGAHLYFFRKIVRGVALGGRSKLVLAAFLLLIFLAPLAARSLESSGFDKLPEILSSTGYLWMGLLFLFITAAATLDMVNLLLNGLQALLKLHRAVMPPPALLATAAAYTVIIGACGWFEANNLRVEHVVLKSSMIPAAAQRIRVVQISDLHVGQIVSEKRIRNVLELVKSNSPDLLVSTGDLVDGHQRHLRGLAELFLEVNPRLGKYAILGNHEYYVGIDRSVNFLLDAGFKVLRNENFIIGEALSITGIDDPRDKQQKLLNDKTELSLLDSSAKGRFRLLLKHRPVVTPESSSKFDLQLSGHVHKGQIFPFNLLTWLNFPVKSGLTDLGRDHFLYVSRGTGVWGPPIRFLAPPEITVIDLLPASAIGRNI